MKYHLKLRGWHVKTAIVTEGRLKSGGQMWQWFNVLLPAFGRISWHGWESRVVMFGYNRC